jgi:Zn-dependent protease
MQGFEGIFYIIILLLSIVVHEVAHGFAAYREGDQTAYLAGRLTLNPLKHIDLVGSVLIPLVLVISGAPFLFGWAKPVPYNPFNFKNRRRGTLFVASAGVLTNFLIALIFGLGLRVLIVTGLASMSLASILSAIITVNILLGVFNLVPIPPLDGARILFALLPEKYYKYERQLEAYSMALVILFILFGWKFIVPVITWLFTLLTGATLQ